MYCILHEHKLNSSESYVLLKQALLKQANLLGLERLWSGLVDTGLRISKAWNVDSHK